MQQSNGSVVNRQMSNSGSQTDAQQQQNRAGTGGSWRCEVLVDTPITRELMDGRPINIQLPPIQLPSGLQNLVGQLTQQSGSQDQHNGRGLERQASLTVTPEGINVNTMPVSIPSDSARRETIHSINSGLAQSRLENNGASSPASTIVSWGRASSTPAAMNTSGSDSSAGGSFVIDIDEESAATNGNNRAHRRRSSSPIRSIGVGSHASHAGTIANVDSIFDTTGGESQLTQRSTGTAATAGTGGTTSSTNTRSTTDANGGRADGEDADVRNLRIRVQELIRRRHQIVHSVVQHIGEFPSLFALGVILSLFCVLLFVLIQFFVYEFSACISLLFCVFHYSDVMSFKRYISGTGSAWFIACKIALRQFMVLNVLGQSIFVFTAAAFQVVSTDPIIPNPTFWSTLYIVFLTEFFILDCLLGVKIIVANLPKLSTIYKRRLYQWLEYTAALYRFCLPFVQWNAYLGALWWTVIYGGIKILLGLAMVWGWLLTTSRIFRATHLGSTPTQEEQTEQCTICFSEFTSPIKLKCSHIFCSECIRTWLDREHTCPICRAVVTKEDNNYRNGESLFPVLF